MNYRSHTPGVEDLLKLLKNGEKHLRLEKSTIQDRLDAMSILVESGRSKSHVQAGVAVRPMILRWKPLSIRVLQALLTGNGC